VCESDSGGVAYAATLVITQILLLAEKAAPPSGVPLTLEYFPAGYYHHSNVEVVIEPLTLTATLSGPLPALKESPIRRSLIQALILIVGIFLGVACSDEIEPMADAAHEAVISVTASDVSYGENSDVQWALDDLLASTTAHAAQRS
jgi:hypothetical protein